MMLYQVECDGNLLLDTRLNLDNYKIYNPKLTKSLNKVNEFSFLIYPNHINFKKLKKMKSIITVYQNGKLIFRGRILDLEEGFYNEKQVICEGELAFLIDSIQRPYSFQGTIKEFLTMLITNHNLQVTEDKQFQIGNVTVIDNNDYINRSDTEYSNTWDLINSSLIDTHGGYIVTRHEDNKVYIDYLREEDFNILNNQGIKFGENLLSVLKTAKGADVATILIPLGATSEETGEALTIRGLADDTTSEIQKIDDYIFNQNEVDKYGKITKVITFSDVTEAKNLLTKSKKYYAQQLKNNMVTITLNSIDMAYINKDLNAFDLGIKIHVESKYHSIDDFYLIDTLEIELLNPTNNKLVIGKSYDSFTETSSSNEKDVESVIQSIITKNEEVMDNKINEVYKQVESNIEANSQELSSYVAENYYLKGETDVLVNSINTEFSQTKDEFNFKFNSFNQSLEDLTNDTEAKFEDIRKYIRFVNGDIILGEAGSELTTRISNGRISFLYNDTLEVAYISERKLYITEAEILNQIVIGSYAFIPRKNGNLSFKKI